MTHRPAFRLSRLCAAVLVLLLSFGLAAPAMAEETIPFSDAYVYMEDDAPKYWLDFTGMVIDNAVLHCRFRSGADDWYETFYILDMDTADYASYLYTIHTIYDEKGFDVSDQFESLTLLMVQNSIIMTVKRNESTLAGGPDENLLSDVYMLEPAEPVFTFEYYEENGNLKYVLESAGGSGVLLRCFFRSGSPEYHEEVYTMEPKNAEPGSYSLEIETVTDSLGNDITGWFESITLTNVQGAVILDVKRDESTLAGGADDNLLTGSYLFEPCVRVTGPSEPAEPYEPEDLCAMAQDHYYSGCGFYPPEAEAYENEDGTITIHLYEITDQGAGLTHTATAAWYTVDAFGVGSDDVFGEPVILTP